MSADERRSAASSASSRARVAASSAASCARTTATSRSAWARMTNHTLTASSRPNAIRLTTTRVTRRSLGEGEAKCQRDHMIGIVIGTGRADARRGAAIQPASHAPRRRGRRAAAAQGRARAVHRRRRPGIAGGDVPRGGWCRDARPRRRGRGRRQQPAASDHPWHVGRRPIQARLGSRSVARDQPAHRASNRTPSGSASRTRSISCPPTTSSSTARTTSRRAISSTMPVSSSGARMRTAASRVSKGRPPSLPPPHGPCYRCLHPEPPPAGLIPSCAEGGVLGVLPGIIGTIQATETVKLILGIGEPLVGRFLLYDALRMRFRVIKLRQDPDCPVCGTHPTIHELRAYDDGDRCAPAATDEDRHDIGSDSAVRQDDRHHGHRAEAAHGSGAKRR